MVPYSGSFQEEFFLLSGQKKSQKLDRPCLSLNMVRRKRFIKWQTLSRNAKSSFEGTNPTPPSPMQQWRPPARTTIVSRTVLSNKVPGRAPYSQHIIIRHWTNWIEANKIICIFGPKIAENKLRSFAGDRGRLTRWPWSFGDGFTWFPPCAALSPKTFLGRSCMQGHGSNTKRRLRSKKKKNTGRSRIEYKPHNFCIAATCQSSEFNLPNERS